MITYFQAGQSFLVAKGNPQNIKTQQDLCGKAIAAETGTTEVDYLNGTGDYEGQGLSSEQCTKAGKAKISVKTFEKDSDALLALQGGQVDAYFADSPVAGYYAIQHADAFELSGLTLGVAKEGISVAKDHPELRAAVQRALSHDGHRRHVPPDPAEVRRRGGQRLQEVGRASRADGRARRAAMTCAAGAAYNYDWDIFFRSVFAPDGLILGGVCR